MKSRGVVFFLLVLMPSCSNLYEQHYKGFSDYESSSVRSKSSFPQKFIFSDANELRSSYCLDSLSSFGLFNYSDNLLYDSVFNSPSVQHISLALYLQKLAHNKINMPVWFEEINMSNHKKLQTIQTDRFYIARDSIKKKVFFILSN